MAGEVGARIFRVLTYLATSDLRATHRERIVHSLSDFASRGSTAPDGGQARGGRRRHGRAPREQHVGRALEVADRVLVLNRGRAVMERAAADLIGDPDTLEQRTSAA